jgi:hypothetical protein
MAGALLDQDVGLGPALTEIGRQGGQAVGEGAQGLIAQDGTRWPPGRLGLGREDRSEIGSRPSGRPEGVRSGAGAGAAEHLDDQAPPMVIVRHIVFSPVSRTRYASPRAWSG